MALDAESPYMYPQKKTHKPNCVRWHTDLPCRRGILSYVDMITFPNAKVKKHMTKHRQHRPLSNARNRNALASFGLLYM